MTENRSALLPDRLKRKPNVRKREQNENNAPLPWRPAGNNNKASSSSKAETCCQGVQPLQRRSVSVADAAFGVPLTSSFSVRESLRSSRVFKTKEASEARPESTKVLGAQSSCQQQSNRAVGPLARAVLQPVGIIASSSRASRASSCGSNSTSGSGGRASYSTLDSAVNICSSPTDDAQHGASPNGSVSHAAQPQHKPGGRAMLQEHRHLPTRTHVPAVAQSCCELLQLLQMDDPLGFDMPAASSSMPAPAAHHSSLPLPLERSGSSTQAAARSFPDGLSQQQEVAVPHAGCGGCSPQQDQQQGLQQHVPAFLEEQQQEQEHPGPCEQQPGQLLCHLQGVHHQQRRRRQQQEPQEDSFAVLQPRRQQPQQLQQEQEQELQHLNMAPNTQPQQQPAATEAWAPQQQQGCMQQQAAALPANGQFLPAQPPQHCMSAAAAAAAAQQHQSKQPQQPDAASHLHAPVQAAWGGGAAAQTLQQPAPSPPRHHPQQMTPRRFAAGRHLASPLRPSNTINNSTAFNQQQQPHSSTSSLLEAMRTLVANSEAATQHLQFIGASPLKISSPGRFAGRGSVLSRAASGAVSAAPTPRQLSRLSQSWTAASPTGGSQPFAGAAAAAAAAAAPPAATAVGAVGDSVRVQLFGDAVGAVAGVLRGTGGQRAATAGASTPGRTAGMDQLHSGASCLQPAVVATAGGGHQGAVAGSTAAPQPLHMGLVLSPAGQGSKALCTSRVAQVLFGTPTAQHRGQPASLAVQQSTALDAAGGLSPGISPQGRKLRPHPAGQGSSSAVPPRDLLQGCDSAVTATGQPLQQEQGLHGWGEGLRCKQQEHRSVLGCGLQPLQQVQAVAGKLTPTAARACGSSGAGVLSCAGMQGATPGAAGSRYAGVTDSGATGSTEANDSDSDSDDGGDVDQGLGGHTRADGAAVKAKQQAGRHQHLQQQQQEGTEECWTVHTNWAAADLDEETAAVAAAAAAAAGLSAQLGRGHPVRLQEHGPFVTAAAQAAGLMGVPPDPAQQQQQQQQGLQAAACSPMWLSRGGGQPVTPAEGSCRQHDLAQQYPPVASPVCLLVPRRLWDSPAAEGH